MSDAMSYNFAGIEGAASASVDDGNVDFFASTGDEGQTVQKLASIWGGSGSEAYQQTQQNWQTTAAEPSGLIVAGWDILKQAPFSGSGVEGPDDLVLEDSSSEERSGVQYQQAADDAASSIGSMGFCKDAFDFTANETADTGTASIDTFSRTFTITVNPSSGDVFDFTATEAESTNGCTGDACNGGAGGILFGDGGDGLNVDGKGDLATYDPDTTIIGPGESFTYTLDPREPAIIMEYAIML